MTKAIELSKGYLTLVDDEDFDWLSEYAWYAKDDTKPWVYAVTTPYLGNYKHKHLRMHRLILEHHGVKITGKTVDHINRQTLDNRKENLRVATASEQGMNSAARKGSSKFKGVGWHKAASKWEAFIRIDGKKKYLGCFDSELDAARRYDEYALHHYGEFACINGV